MKGTLDEAGSSDIGHRPWPGWKRLLQSGLGAERGRRPEKANCRRRSRETDFAGGAASQGRIGDGSSARAAGKMYRRLLRSEEVMPTALGNDPSTVMAGP